MKNLLGRLNFRYVGIFALFFSLVAFQSVTERLTSGTGLESSEWNLSPGDKLRYELWSEEFGKIPITIDIWKKNKTTWGTERIWIRGTIVDLYYTFVGGNTSVLTNYLCLDSIHGATLSYSNLSISRSPPYTDFNPFRALRSMSSEAFLIPIASPKFQWDGSITESSFDPSPLPERDNTSVYYIPSRRNENTTGTIDNSTLFYLENSRIPAIMVYRKIEGEVVPGSLPGGDRITNYRFHYVAWYARQWGILLSYHFKLEFLGQGGWVIDQYNDIHRLERTSFALIKEKASESNETSFSWTSILIAFGMIMFLRRKPYRIFNCRGENRSLRLS